MFVRRSEGKKAGFRVETDKQKLAQQSKNITLSHLPVFPHQTSVFPRLCEDSPQNIVMVWLDQPRRHPETQLYCGYGILR